MSKTKEKIFEEMLEMQAMEETAMKYYTSIISDPDVQSEEVKIVFQGIAKDENRHVQLVGQILGIIKKIL